jgi:FMN phosphatase YigB (HAD superfamily)
MVGDSLVKDYPAAELGMDFYLLLNEDSPEADQQKAFEGKKGNRKEFLAYVESL